MNFAEKNLNAIVKYFESGCKKTQLLGLELEHFVVDADGRALPYSGGVEEILKRLAETYGEPIFNGEDGIIGVQGKDASISIEPAAQLEISINPMESVDEIYRIGQEFYAVLAPILADMNAALETGGLYTKSAPEELPLIPKKRYEYMDKYFETTGTHGKYMMRSTAATQVSIDYSDERDFKKKFRAANILGPILALLYDSTGRMARTHIWNNVDPDRAMVVPGALDADFGFRDYAEYVYNLPSIFTMRDGRTVYTGKQPVAELFAEKLLTTADIEHIISMAFPDVCLKKRIEIRVADSMPLAQAAEYTALLKEIFYNEANLDKLCQGTLDIKNADVARIKQAFIASKAPGEMRTVNRRYENIVRERFAENVRDGKKAAEYMQNSTAVYKGVPVACLYMPKIFPQSAWALLQEATTKICTILDKVTARYLRDPDYRKLFPFPPALEELILSDAGYPALLPLARLDIFLDERTLDFKFCEFNADGSSAMNEDREINRAIRDCDALRQFQEEHECTLTACELFDSWVREFLAIYGSYKGHKQPRPGEKPMPSRPRVAIVDFLENATLSEFEEFREAFRRGGCEAEICDIRHLRFADGALKMPDGRTIDAIYRRAVTRDIMDNLPEVTDFLQAVRENAVCLIGHFRTQIIHNKAIFRILREHQTLDFLTEDEREFIRRHIPRTFALTAEDAAAIQTALADKDNWLIKPEDFYASKGVFAGADMKQSAWQKAVAAATDSNYILQEYCKPYRSVNIGFNTANNGGGYEFKEYNNLTGLFVYNGKLQGVYSRAGLQNTISTPAGAFTLASLRYCGTASANASEFIAFARIP